MSKFDYEPVDNTPVEIPTRLRLPQSRTDQIRAYIRAELSRQASDQSFESFEEADDIEPDDEEGLPYTPYELSALEPPAPTNPPTKQGEAEGQQPAGPAASSEVPAVNPTTAASDGTK